eukprot:5012338-Alexandrium_andersonii.AAC.1
MASLAAQLGQLGVGGGKAEPLRGRCGRRAMQLPAVAATGSSGRCASPRALGAVHEERAEPL